MSDGLRAAVSRSGLVVTLIAATLVLSLVPAATAQEGPTPGTTALESMAERWRRTLEAGAGMPAEIDDYARWYADPPTEPPDGRPDPAQVIRRGRRSSGAVALTFDDGYNSTACASIARTLRDNDAIGTFFINGNLLKKDPRKWRRILRGMPVGNHTRSHPFLTHEPHPVVRRQIRDNETIHENSLGRPMLKVMRPPYGAYGERIGRIATELGYDHVVFWSVDTHDWKKGVGVRAITRRATRASPGSIILMHCARNATAKALPAIIRHYQRRGIELAGLDEVLRDAKPARRGWTPDRYDRP